MGGGHGHGYRARFPEGRGMDFIFLLAVLFIAGCFIWRKRLGGFLRGRKKALQDPPVQLEERPVVVAYKVLAYNARDYKDTGELENMMELRLEKCLAGLTRQGVKYEVGFHAAGYVMVYLVKYWY